MRFLGHLRQKTVVVYDSVHKGFMYNLQVGYVIRGCGSIR